MAWMTGQKLVALGYHLMRVGLSGVKVDKKSETNLSEDQARFLIGHLRKAKAPAEKERYERQRALLEHSQAATTTERRKVAARVR